MQPSPTITLGATAANDRLPMLSLASLLVLLVWLLPSPVLGAQQQDPASMITAASTSKKATGLAGCTFVNLKKLTRTSYFGSYLAAPLKAAREEQR